MAEKMFTQAEVNQIVSERLRRVKAVSEENANRDQTDNAGSNNSEAPHGAEVTVVESDNNDIEERENSIQSREGRIACKEYIDSLSLSKEQKNAVYECIDTDNPEEFKRKTDALVSALGLGRKVQIVGKTNSEDKDDRLRRIFLRS